MSAARHLLATPWFARFAAQWVVAGAAAGAGACAIALATALLERWVIDAIIWFDAPMVMQIVGVAAAFVAGVVLGWAQWTVLRSELDRALGPTWVGATALATALTAVLALADRAASAAGEGPGVGAVLVVLPAGLTLGALLGIAQWAVLRRHVTGAGWWIVSSVVSWGLAAAAAAPVYDALAHGDAPPVRAVLAMIAILVAALVAAIPSGLVMAALLARMPALRAPRPGPVGR